MFLGKANCSGLMWEQQRLPGPTNAWSQEPVTVLRVWRGTLLHQTEVHGYPYRDSPVPLSKKDSDSTTDQLTRDGGFP